MTTIPGHNQIFQQSGIAQELSQQAHSAKPSPDQIAALAQAQEAVQNSTIQSSEESERLKQQKEERKKNMAVKMVKQKRKNREEELPMDTDAKGRLLDTTV